MVRFSVAGKKRRAFSSPSSSSGSCGDEAERNSAGEGEVRSPKGVRRADGITVTIDPDTLDCPICFEVLSVPVYQCRNGHVSCSACCKRMKNKCYVCPYPLGPGRCVALEKVLESLKTPCPYADKGCKESMAFASSNSHKEQCIYSPCSCPFPGCEFEGHLSLLSCHFTTVHAGLPSFRYNVPFDVCLRECTSMQILQGEDGVLYLLQNTRIMSVGNSVTLNCIHPNIPKGNIMYELRVANADSSLTLSTSVLGLKKWEGVSPSKEFLLVPHSFFDLKKGFIVEVRVRRVDS